MRKVPAGMVAVLVAVLGAAVIWTIASVLGNRPVDPRPEVQRMPDERDASPLVSWSRVVEVDVGPGHVGPWRMNRSDWRYVDDPAVALDGEGGAGIAWVDQARKDVLFQRYGRDGEPEPPGPVNVSRSPDVFSWLPRLAIPSADRVYLLWQEIVFSGGTHGGEAFFARSTDGGRTFGKPIDLSNTPAGAGKGRLSPRRWHNGSLDLAVGPEGAVYVAWTVYEGSLWFARSADGGQNFSEPLRVTIGGEGEPARVPSLAAGPDGTIHLAWAVGEDAAADLRYASSRNGGGSFGEPGVLFSGGGHADAPSLAVDGEGALHIAYSEVPSAGAGAPRVLYARAADGAIEQPREVSGRHDGEFAGAAFPTLDLDGAGNPYLVWELFFQGADRSRGLGFTASPDGGQSFAEPTVVPGTVDEAFAMNGSLQGLLLRKLAVDEAGDLAVVASSFEPGEASRVVLVQGRTVGR